MNNAVTAAQAIARSIRHNEIVHLEYDAHEYSVLYGESDSVNHGKEEIEFLGIRASGSETREWRVHMANGPHVPLKC